MRRERNMAQMKGQNKTPEKELSEVEIANLSGAVLKILVIRMLRDLIEYCQHIREKMKATLRKIKKKLQRTISVAEEAGIQINNLEHKEAISIQPEEQKEKRI